VLYPFTDIAAAAAVAGLHVTQLYDANCYVARWNVSTGPVLKRRSVSAEKYWIGPIHFWPDRAFSSNNRFPSTLIMPIA